MTESKQQTSVISAFGLSKEFRDFWHRPKAKAVNDIDFDVYEGEIVGLLGPNGSGKSTTVKIILGLLYPTGGQIKVFDHSPRDVATKNRIGYLPEESYLYKYLTALETLEFFGSLFNLSKSERIHRSNQLLEMVGLNHARNRPVGEFSKGMQRRIGLAQAMINDPDLLILDEPTSGLDPVGCREVKDVIQLMKKRGKTVLITSHLLSDVEDICDRVIILYGGKIRATGTLSELLTVPDASRITTPLLDPKVTEKVIKILREELAGEEFSIDKPRKSLEDFFLEVINQAKEEKIETSGVVSGGSIAEYLTADDEIDSKVVLDALTETADESKEEFPDEADIEEELDEPAVDEEKLKGLITDTTSESREQIEDSQESESKEDLSEVNKKLQNLLSDK